MKKNKLTLDTFKIAAFSNKSSIVGGTGVGDDTQTDRTRVQENCKFTSLIKIETK